MKNNAFFLLLLLLSFITKFSNSQDFWEIVPTPDTANPMTITIHNNGDIFSGSNGVYLSHDNGDTWEFKGLFGTVVGSIAIDSLDNVFAGTGSKIYKSTDYGDNWYQVNNTFGNNIPLAAGTNGLMFSGGGINIGYLLRSLDYGESWDTVFIFPGAFENVTDILLSPSGVFYFATTAYMGGGGGVYRSVDNGETVEFIGLLYHYVRALSLNSSGSLFAAVYGHHYTGIGGCYIYDEINSDWLFLTDNLNAKGIVINSNDDIYLGVSNEAGGIGGVYRSLDGGETWQWINDGLSFNSIVGLFISPDDYIFPLTYAIHELHKSINPTVSVINKQSDNIEVDLFPNPFVESLYLKINSSVSSNNCSLVVFDIKGALIKKMDFTNSGNARILTIDGSDWVPGVYFYRVIIGDYRHSGKIIKLN
jgi:hypothetical protein